MAGTKDSPRPETRPRDEAEATPTDIAKEVAYYQAIALREMRAPGTLLFRLPLAGR